MKETIIANQNEIPQIIIQKKQKHFQEIFSPHWESVYSSSPLLAASEKLLMISDSKKIIAWVNFYLDTYNLCFRNFMVAEDYRGKGIAGTVLNKLESLAINHHKELIQTNQKPTDINLMFLRSLPYFNSTDKNDSEEIFKFGNYLKKQGFQTCEYNKSSIGDEEKAGIKAYEIMFPKKITKLKIFRKCVVNSSGTLRQDIVLNQAIQDELRKLNFQQWQIVMDGLAWKLNTYSKTKKISYRYDLCPICKEMKSTEQDSDNCKKCFIRKTCQEPFREIGRFKEDYEISGAYFLAVQRFLMNIMML